MGTDRMPWFRVDDNIVMHEKVLAAGNAALGLWVRAGAWSMHELSDGFIPEIIAKKLGKKSEISALVAVGLWIQVDEGFMFHAWSKDGRQPTREQVESRRESDRNRQSRGRETQALSRRDKTVTPPVTPPVSHGVSHGVTPLVPSHPIPITETTTVVSAQTLVGEWLEHCRERPPSRITGQTSREISGLLAEGINPDHIRAGLGAWHAKGAHPSTLASFVNEAMNAKPSGAKRSTTDDRVAAALKLAHQLDQQPQLQIGNR